MPDDAQDSTGQEPVEGGVRYDLSLEGDGLSLERQVSEDVALEIVSLVLGRRLGAAALGRTSTRRPSREAVSEAEATGSRVMAEPDVSVGEFLDETGASNNFQRIAAIALWKQEHLGDRFVTQQELPEWFERAGRPVPKNLSRDLRIATERSLIAESVAKPDHYYITDTFEKKLKGGES